jgi:DNA-binding response OmpR family regulator
MSRIIRKNDPAIPIIFLSAHSETCDLLPALKLKPDDYLLKPFVKEELLIALAKSARNLPFFSKKVYELGAGAQYVFGKKSILFRDNAILLTRHESDLLELLICKEGEIVTYGEIEAYAYRGEYMSPDAIKTLVKKLRKKLPEDRIKNVVAIGYRLH